MTINELNNLTLADIESRIAALDTEVNSLGESDATDETIKRINDAATEKQMLLSRKSELEAIEMRKQNAEQVANGAGTPVERGGVNPIEERAKQLVETGKMELRALLSTGVLTPTAVKQEIGELPEVMSSIVDDVHSFSLDGSAGAWAYAYRLTDSAAAKVTEGEKIGGTAGTFGKGEIKPETWGILDEISLQVKHFTPLAYEASIRNNAYLALRRYAKAKIAAAILNDTTMVEQVEELALDENFLRTLVLGFNADESVAGGAKLYLSKASLMKLGKVRGEDKRPVYAITFTDENNGTITEGGMQVPFSILSNLGEQHSETNGIKEGAADVMIYGQMGAVDMPLWGNYVIETDEGGEYFQKYMLGIRGVQSAGVGVVRKAAVQVINNKANP